MSLKPGMTYSQLKKEEAFDTGYLEGTQLKSLLVSEIKAADAWRNKTANPNGIPVPTEQGESAQYSNQATPGQRSFEEPQQKSFNARLKDIRKELMSEMKKSEKAEKSCGTCGNLHKATDKCAKKELTKGMNYKELFKTAAPKAPRAPENTLANMKKTAEAAPAPVKAELKKSDVAEKIAKAREFIAKIQPAK